MNRSSLCSLTRYGMRSLASATFLTAFLISLTMTGAAPAHAAIYKCISSTGSVMYSGRKCPEEDTTARIIADSGVGSGNKRRAPAAAIPTLPATRADEERRLMESDLEQVP